MTPSPSNPNDRENEYEEPRSRRPQNSEGRREERGAARGSGGQRETPRRSESERGRSEGKNQPRNSDSRSPRRGRSDSSGGPSRSDSGGGSGRGYRDNRSGGPTRESDRGGERGSVERSRTGRQSRGFGGSRPSAAFRGSESSGGEDRYRSSGIGDRGRDRSASTTPTASDRRRLTSARDSELPRWVKEEITRSTTKERRDPALLELEEGLEEFSSERYGAAASRLRKAKELAPRSATVREILGLSAYYIEEWEEALREIRTFRRLTGDPGHMAIEMDCLRALERPQEVDKTWERFEEIGGSRDADDEVRVVYASHLLDQGRIMDAWKIIKPGRLVANPTESAVRRWAVAAKVAAQAGDRESCATIIGAIRREAPEVEWLGDLTEELGM